MLEASPTLAMKYLIPSLSLLILTSCSHAIAPEVPEVLEVSHDKLVERDGVTYQVDSDEPFTGSSVRFYENGQLENRTDYQDGKKEGIHGRFLEHSNDESYFSVLLTRNIKFYHSNICTTQNSND